MKLVHPSASATKRKARARRTLPPEALCPTCTRELAVFFRGRAFCIHCEQAELFPAEAIAAHQARTGQITREVAK